MDEKEELINMIGEYLCIYFSTETIGNLKYNIGHYSKVPNIRKYDELTIGQLFVFYKIDRLEALDIITKDLANNLRQLYDLYLTINEKIGEEACKEIWNNDKQQNDILQTLHNKSDQIEFLLRRYHLVINETHLFNMMDIIFENEKYEKMDNNKEQKIIIKLLKN